MNKNEYLKVMKRILSFNLLIAFVVVVCSCSDKTTKVGDWSDNIQLSAKSVVLSASSDSVVLKTGGSSWWITDVTVGDVHFNNHMYVGHETDTCSIKHDGFVVVRRDKSTLVIKVDENLLAVQRIITVGLEAGDYFDRVTITQKTK